VTVDFHVHAFADEIAEKAITVLNGNSGFSPYTNGTISETRRLLLKWGADYGVMLPIATKPTQQLKINNWASEQKHAKTAESAGIIPFGSVHPDADDIPEELARIKSLGLKGIKLHPDYQNAFLFDEKMRVIYKNCAELGLILVLHMGHDPVSPYVRHAMPCHLAEIADAYPALKIVGAHLGGMFAWEEVARYLCGKKNVWLDTAFLAGYINPELFTAIIRKHTAERILFASDCPWHTPEQERGFIETLPLSESERERIYCGNAEELLGVI